MTKQELERAYSKALKGGMEMLEMAARLDALADETVTENETLLIKMIAMALRKRYEIMFE